MRVRGVCHTGTMTEHIDHLLQQSGVPFFAPDDATLSGSELAMARIVAVLREEWEGLDGHQQRTLVSALEASTLATEEAESAGLTELRERGLIAEA
ncbi:hypothetical protein FRC0104_02377 [Corynebacterium diphtheriae]|nr:hypothetical protein FRC0104_02377 [Corynebacterium diphtheriae]